VGIGSTFWFTARFEKQAASSSVQTTGCEWPRWRILVLEADDISRCHLQEQIHSWKLDSLGATSVPEAMAALAASVEEGRPFHCALLDGCLEEAELHQLALRIRCEPALGTVRLVSMAEQPIAPEKVSSWLAAGFVA